MSAFGDWQLGLQLLEVMEKQLVKGDVITYSAVISACEEGFQWQMLGPFFGKGWFLQIYMWKNMNKKQWQVQ